MQGNKPHYGSSVQSGRIFCWVISRAYVQRFYQDTAITVSWILVAAMHWFNKSRCYHREHAQIYSVVAVQWHTDEKPWWQNGWDSCEYVILSYSAWDQCDLADFCWWGIKSLSISLNSSTDCKIFKCYWSKRFFAYYAIYANFCSKPSVKETASMTMCKCLNFCLMRFHKMKHWFYTSSGGLPVLAKKKLTQYRFTVENESTIVIQHTFLKGALKTNFTRQVFHSSGFLALSWGKCKRSYKADVRREKLLN